MKSYGNNANEKNSVWLHKSSRLHYHKRINILNNRKCHELTVTMESSWLHSLCLSLVSGYLMIVSSSPKDPARDTAPSRPATSHAPTTHESISQEPVAFLVQRFPGPSHTLLERSPREEHQVGKPSWPLAVREHERIRGVSGICRTRLQIRSHAQEEP